MATHPQSKRHGSKPARVTAGKQRRAPLMERNKVSRDAAEEAVRTLLRWAGEDPQRDPDLYRQIGRAACRARVFRAV